MSDAIQQAALAFDASMGNTSSSDGGGGGASETKAVESIFDNFNTHLDTSESVAGGDGDIKPEKKQAKKPVAKDPDDDDDDLGDDNDLDDDQDDDQDPDDDEGKDEDEADDDDDGDDGLGELADQEFTVMVDGEEKTVKLKEALNGYIRTETFHKHMNIVNEGKQAVAAAARDTIARRNAAIEKLTEAETILTSVMPQEPNWDALYDAPGADIKSIRSMQKQFETLKANIDSVKKTRADAEKAAAEEEAKNTEDYVKEEFGKFIEKNPKIRKPADLQKELHSMKRTALALGFTEQEILQVADSRMLLIMQKASKYDRIMAHKPKAVVPGKGNNKAGNAPIRSRNVQGKAVQKDFDRANKRLIQSGSVEAAAGVFDQILKRGR